MTISATYFDGISAFGHEVQLTADADQLFLSGYSATRRYPRSACRMAQPFALAPCVIDFSDGSHCIVPHRERSPLEAMMHYAPSLVERWQRRWVAALAAVVAIMMMIWIGYSRGIPALSAAIVDAMPLSAEQRLGDLTLRAMEGDTLKPSTLSAQKQAQINAAFAPMRSHARRMPVRLLVRSAPDVGANAFALPNGTIVVTDELVRLLARQGEFSEALLELQGILAHEVGHVELRHSVRSMGQSSATMLGSWVLLGDFSAVAAGLPALASELSYSRAMEHEADSFAAATLQRMGSTPLVLADALTALQAATGANAASQDRLPEWMRTSFDFVSTHPATGSRVARLRALASKGNPDE